MSTIMGVELDPGFCGALYNPPFIPYFGEESAFSLITVCLELLILLFLLSCILRKKWYHCRGEDGKARSLLLPAYDRVLYYYCIVTLLRIVFYSLQFVYEMLTPDINTADPDYEVRILCDPGLRRMCWIVITVCQPIRIRPGFCWAT